MFRCIRVDTFVWIVWTEESWLQKYANAEDQETPIEEQQTKNDDNDNSDQVQSEYKPSSSTGGRSRVYLDIEIGGSLAGRIEIEVRKAQKMGLKGITDVYFM